MLQFPAQFRSLLDGFEFSDLLPCLGQVLRNGIPSSGIRSLPRVHILREFSKTTPVNAIPHIAPLPKKLGVAIQRALEQVQSCPSILQIMGDS